MLQRSLTRALPKATTGTTCVTCVCRCGQRLPAATGRQQQRRRKTSLNAAHPDVWSKETRKRRVLTAEERREKRLQMEGTSNWQMLHIDAMVRDKFIKAPPQDVFDFLDAFADLCKRSGYRSSTSSPVDLTALQELLDRHNIDEPDSNWLAHQLLNSRKAEDNLYGKKFMFALSHAGSETATVRIMRQALIETRDSSRKLRATEIRHALAHLEEIGARGDDHQAMVLLGKVNRKLGHVDAAIELWTGAMDLIVEKAAKSSGTPWKSLLEQDPKDKALMYVDLETPWIELYTTHFGRQEWAKAKEAIDVGCRMDDPFSHYYAADFAKDWTADGELSISSTWLYHMTKAAASGHAKAAHELAYFYAYSRWPYIVDEPPDHVKPTPFDSYPPGGTEIGAEKSAGFAQNLKQFVGLGPKQTLEPSEDIFRSAHFPPDPVGRITVAMKWLDLAQFGGYAPSFLLRAKLNLMKTLRSDAKVPDAALQLKDERYIYASEADREADHPIERAPGGSSDSEIAESTAEKAEGSDTSTSSIRNPFYDTEWAYGHLAYVFNAHAAFVARQEGLDAITRARKQGRKINVTDIDETMLTEDGIEFTRARLARRDGETIEGLSAAAKGFLRFPEVREMYTDDRAGILKDDAGPEEIDIWEEAKQICEEMKWDMRDQDGRLMYKFGLR